MGSLGSGLGELVDKSLTTTAETVKNVWEGTHSLKSTLESTDEGKLYLEHYQNVGLPAYNQTKEQLQKAALERVKADTVTNKANLGKPGFTPIDTRINSGEIESKARQAMRAKMHGPKDAIPVALAQSIQTKHGDLAVQNFANAVSMLTHDFVDPTKAVDEEGAPAALRKNQNTAPYSRFKMNLQNAGITLTHGTSPAYTPVGKTEAAVTKAIYQTFSPLMVLNHTSTIFNGLFGTHPDVFFKALGQSMGRSLDANVNKLQSRVISGVFAESSMREIEDWNRFEATGSNEFLTHPAGQFLYKSFHMPFFNNVRKLQLLTGANMGKMMAEQTAAEFVQKPNDKVLLWNLSELGLDPGKILANGGKLDDQDLAKAMFKVTNKHYLMDNSVNKSLFTQSTWFGRLLGTYHGFVTSQARMMREAMFQDWKNQGTAAVMRNLAVGAILTPILGEAVKITNLTITGQNAGGSLHKDLQNIEGKHGAEGVARAYFGALSHAAMFGIYNHLLQGAFTHHLIADAAGPVGSAVGQLAEDSSMAGENIYKHKGYKSLKKAQHYLAPVERDLAYDTPGVSLLAHLLMHRVLPKANENPKHAVERELWHHVRHEDSSGKPLPDDSSTDKTNQ